jgi:hypothetical protein
MTFNSLNHFTRIAPSACGRAKSQFLSDVAGQALPFDAEPDESESPFKTNGERLSL